ncbi:hypothetical protein FACS1894151_02810 [Spirochaetia bacterium]|nr:hypothetical protein FACS1894151_02810 [Spirochaetia bacterium]
MGEKKKQVPLRLSDSLWKELAVWAEDDFRSVNGQIEYLLTECVRHRKKGRREDVPEDQAGSESLIQS